MCGVINGISADRGMYNVLECDVWLGVCCWGVLCGVGVCSVW